VRLTDLRLDPPAAGEVLVRMLASGVCHSDLHVVDGDWARPAGLVLGHEGAAIVEAAGPHHPQESAATGAKPRPGDLVVLAWTAPCERCVACARAEPWLCLAPAGAGHRFDDRLVRLRLADGSPVGAYSGVGTFCTRQVVAASAAIPVDPSVPPELAALIGCAASTGVGAVRNTARVQPGDSVVVVGLGGVGLSALIAATVAGAWPLIAVDVEPAKLALAGDLGATDGATPGEVRSLTRALPRGGADHVIECAGTRASVELAVELARPGGQVTLVGMTPQGQRADFDVYRLVEEGKRIVGCTYGSSVPARDFPAIAADVVSGRLPLGRLVSQTIALEDLPVALDALRRRDGARRVVRFAGPA
jgi:S-(hydroxymethyl)glutathione dehydrogenase/alcohol dehydrogenase